MQAVEPDILPVALLHRGRSAGDSPDAGLPVPVLHSWKES